MLEAEPTGQRGLAATGSDRDISVIGTIPC